jgi:hypothetical protein
MGRFHLIDVNLGLLMSVLMVFTTMCFVPAACFAPFSFIRDRRVVFFNVILALTCIAAHIQSNSSYSGSFGSVAGRVMFVLAFPNAGRLQDKICLRRYAPFLASTND